MMNEMAAAPDAASDIEYSGRKANTELDNFKLLGKSKHQQYFTSNELAETIYKMLEPMLDPRGKMSDLSVIDPTCGSGRLLLPWKRAGARVMGIELDSEAASAAKRLIGKDNLRVGDILDYAEHLRGFNIAVTNPPYSIWWDISGRRLSFDSAAGRQILGNYF